MAMIANEQQQYQPSNLLDTLIVTLGLKNDAALCRALEIRPPILSKIRNRHMPISSALLLRMHEVTDISIRDLRGLMGDRRRNHRASAAHGIAKLGAETLSASISQL